MTLSRVPLFHGLPEDLMEQLAALGRPVRRERHAAFFRQGEPASALFVVESGRVTIRQVDAEGHEVTLRWVGPGGMFGAVALLGYPAYPASAVAVEQTCALAFDGQALGELMANCPKMARNALEHVAAQLVEMQERYRELATERVERRIARALLRFVRQAGRRVDGGVLIDMPLSREDLGKLTGTTLFTVSRTLSAWEREGIVKLGRERIVVSRPHHLVRVAEDLPAPSPSAAPGPDAPAHPSGNGRL